MSNEFQIPREKKLKPIIEVAKELGLDESELELYGKYKAKVSLGVLERLKDRPKGKYIAVTAISPTPLGEGKTVTTIGLGEALGKLNKRAIVTIREPSMGPVFGIKGGGAGGGNAQALPMEELNLHFTGDSHAVSIAHNLLAAMIDAHIFHGNSLDIEPQSITWTRVLDVLDRPLRNVIIGINGSGILRQTSFEVTAASEIMAILALADSLADLRLRLGKIIVGSSRSGEAITAEKLKAAGAMAALLKDAIKPNLIQTSENTPLLAHAGPFGNIAHGNSSIVADKIALRLAEYVVTESGFGADLGFEKLCDVKCRNPELKPDAAVLVCTIRSLKMHSDRFKISPGKPLDPKLMKCDVEAVLAGAANLVKQIQNVKLFKVPAVVAINKFPYDFEEEINAVRCLAQDAKADGVAVSEVFQKGGEGGLELAEAIIAASKNPTKFEPLYPLKSSIKSKIETIATKLYNASGVSYESAALKKIKQYNDLGLDNLPICMAKTQYSLSHDPKLRGCPSDYTLPILDLKIAAGAGVIVAYCGEIHTMPGLPSEPNAHQIDIDENGRIIGMF